MQYQSFVAPGSDAEFILTHGMSREAYADKRAQLQREQFRNSAIVAVSGEPPSDINVRGLGPKHALYVRIWTWRQREAKELAVLQERKIGLQQIIDGVETVVRNGIARLAKSMLLGRAHQNDTDEIEIAKELVAERRAEAAKAAMPELSQQIELAQIRVARLAEREAEARLEVIAEMADSAGLLKAYLQKIQEFQKITAQVIGLVRLVGRGQSRFGNQDVVEVPKISLPSIAGIDWNDYNLKSNADDSLFRSIETALRLDPRSVPHIQLP